MTNIENAISALKPNQLLRISPHGTSMTPFFLGDRDEVFVAFPLFPLKKGDIALYLRSNDIYVIHRVYKRVLTSTGYEYYMLGDNQTEPEGPITEDQIHAVAVSFTRKGKTIHCKKNIGYRILVSLWMLLRPMRPCIIKLRFLFKKK